MFGIITFAISILTVPVCFFILLKNRKKLYSQRFQQQFGSFTEVEYENSRFGDFYCILYMLRRLFYTLAIVHIRKSVSVIIFVFQIFSLMELVLIIKLQINIKSTFIWIRMLNELTILMISYSLIHFNDFFDFPDERSYIGYVMIAIVLSNILMNVFIVGR